MNIVFDEEQQLVRVRQTKVSGLYGLIIRWGFAKDQRSAGMVLAIAAGCMILLALGIVVFAPGNGGDISQQEYLRNGNITAPPQP
ncbi:MAG: hypothetical protein V4682_03460 [Patescibacteria group bacterium]